MPDSNCGLSKEEPFTSRR